MLVELEPYSGDGIVESIAEVCAVTPEAARAALQRVRSRVRARAAALALAAAGLCALGSWLAATRTAPAPVDDPPAQGMRPVRLSGG